MQYNKYICFTQRENLQQLSQSETAANKSPRDTPTKSKKNNKDVIKKKDENTKDEKQEINTQTNTSFAINTKETMKEIKELQKETPVKEIKESIKETALIVQSANKETKKTKKKNDILAQIGKMFPSSRFLLSLIGNHLYGYLIL